MFAFIDSWWWLEGVCALVLGVWAGRRWAYAKVKAECAASSCVALDDLRVENMGLRAEQVKAQKVNEFQRQTLLENGKKIHELKTANGKLGRELERLTHQIPRPVRRMVG